MDTTYHSNISVETLSLLDCDVRNFDFNHPIKNIFFDNIEYIRKLDASGKARPCILDNVERSLLYHTCYLGFDQFECTNCDNWNIIPHSCHSRFCNACGVKYAKQLAAKATTALIDTLSLLFPKNLETGSDRLVLDSIYCLLLLETPFPFLPINLLLINSKKKLSDTHYKFKDIPVHNEFGMFATIHTFGKDLKWNPHIHCLIPELIYSLKKDKIKTFHHFNFTKLRKTFQFELIRLIQEAGGLMKPEEKNRLYKKHPKGFYANASKKTLDKVHALLGIKKNKDYSRETRTKALKNKLNKLKYRTHLIDSFNRDPIQCKCGAIMQYTYTYNPFKDKRNDRTYRKRCIDGMMRMYKRRI